MNKKAYQGNLKLSQRETFDENLEKSLVGFLSGFVTSGLLGRYVENAIAQSNAAQDEAGMYMLLASCVLLPLIGTLGYRSEAGILGKKVF